MQKQIFMNHMILLSEEIFKFLIIVLYPQQDTKKKMYASFNFCLCIRDHKTHNKFLLYGKHHSEE